MRRVHVQAWDACAHGARAYAHMGCMCICTYGVRAWGACMQRLHAGMASLYAALVLGDDMYMCMYMYLRAASSACTSRSSLEMRGESRKIPRGSRRAPRRERPPGTGSLSK